MEWREEEETTEGERNRETQAEQRDSCRLCCTLDREKALVLRYPLWFLKLFKQPESGVNVCLLLS